MTINTDIFERQVNIIRLVRSELRKQISVPSIRTASFSFYENLVVFDSRCQSNNHTTMRTGVPRRVTVRIAQGHIIVQYAPTHRFIGPILEPPDEIVFGGKEDRAEKNCAYFIAIYLARGKAKLQ